VGPVVEAVRLEASGELRQVRLDMTPSRDAVSQQLGGLATFVGQFSRQGVCVLCLRDPEPEVPANAGKLPYPLEEEQVNGAALMIRMSDESEPLDFSLEDFRVLESEQAELKARGDPERKAAEAAARDAEADEDEDKDDEPDEDEEGGEEAEGGEEGEGDEEDREEGEGGEGEDEEGEEDGEGEEAGGEEKDDEEDDDGEEDEDEDEEDEDEDDEDAESDDDDEDEDEDDKPSKKSAPKKRGGAPLPAPVKKAAKRS
jgi:hypothetical protein